MNNIILCGFMGCGKSTIGRILSKRAGLEFVDMDLYIQDKAGMTVSEIFEKYGEERFREMETEACRELAERENLVIAAGGGTLAFQRNIDILKSSGKIIFIDVSYENLCIRLRRDTRRPLLQVENRDERIKELLEKRLPIYRGAASVIMNGNFTSGVVASNIMSVIR
ncbi:MAG: shikimate kinase [Ruminococcus sp.]|jgi:shikimate kinase|nr:shikimate kinase [Ruminococcus sp.]